VWLDLRVIGLLCLNNPSHVGVDVVALNRRVAHANTHLESQSMNGVKGKRAKTKDGKVPFKMGPIMCHLGEIEGTSAAMESFVSDHSERQANEQQENDDKRAMAAAKLKESNRTLPQRLVDTKAKIAAPPAKNKVGDSREYAKCLVQQARLAEDNALADSIQLMLKTKKGVELVNLVTAMAHPVQH